MLGFGWCVGYEGRQSGTPYATQVQKKLKISEYSQDEDFFKDDWLEATPFQATYQSEYQPDQTMSDYSPEDLAMSSAIEGFQPMKYSFLGNRAESDDYDRTYGVKQGAIRRKLKKKIMAQNIMGTKAGQWSARKSQELKRQYEESCEKKGLKPY